MKNNFKEKEMIFCSNCTYYEEKSCKHPSNIKTVSHYDAPYQEEIHLPCMINETNDCKWFKKRGFLDIVFGEENKI